MQVDGIREINEDIESSEISDSDGDVIPKKTKTIRNLIGPLERDNLRFRSMAKYKAILDGEMQMYMDIEQ